MGSVGIGQLRDMLADDFQQARLILGSVAGADQIGSVEARMNTVKIGGNAPGLLENKYSGGVVPWLKSYFKKHFAFALCYGT